MAIRRVLNSQVKVGAPGEVHLHARAVIGGTGAVTSTVGRYVAIARTGVGTYTATVENSGGLINYLYADVSLTNEAAVLHAHITGVNLTTGVFTIKVDASDGTDTDPTSGASLCFRCVAVNTSIDITV